jgi:hypothetical protein
MKKAQKRALHLAAETLRLLSARQLGEVAGGVTTTEFTVTSLGEYPAVRCTIIRVDPAG